MAKKNDDVAESFVIPSNPVDRKRIKDALYEIVGYYRLQEDNKEKIKDVVLMLNETFKLPKKLTPKLAKTIFNSNYDQVTEDNQQFEILMDTIVMPQTAGTSTQAADDSE